MPRFFSENFSESHKITGQDAKHIAKSLRMAVGDKLTVCDTRGVDYYCEILKICEDEIDLSVIKTDKNNTEPTIKAVLFQCMPKGDKFDYITQKAVELGVNTIVPVISQRCISRPDKKSAEKKVLRLQRIADEAAKQSGRGILPKVELPITFDECMTLLKDYEKSILFYELGGSPLETIISKSTKSVAIIIGPEGGIAEEEFGKAVMSGAVAATLGKRILRTETAPIAALSNIMLLSGNMQ